MSIGMLPDTSQYYVLVYAGVASCYIPMLDVYSKEGRLISKEQISNGCGGDCGYKCEDVLVITSINDIEETFTEESYTCDSLGKETPGTWEKTVDVNKFSVNKLGKISKTVSHTAEKR